MFLMAPIIIICHGTYALNGNIISNRNMIKEFPQLSPFLRYTVYLLRCSYVEEPFSERVRGKQWLQEALRCLWTITIRLPVPEVTEAAVNLFPSNFWVIPSQTLGYLQVGILQVKMGRVSVHVGVLHFFAAPWVGHTIPGRHVLPTEVVVLFAKAISTSRKNGFAIVRKYI